MSDERVDQIEMCIKVAWEETAMTNERRDAILSELRTLRAAQEECDELKKNSDEHYKRVLFYKKKYESLFNGFSEYLDNPEQFVAEVEAWRAVRACHDDAKWVGKMLAVLIEIRNQIARLDAMKEGESNGS